MFDFGLPYRTWRNRTTGIICPRFVASNLIFHQTDYVFSIRIVSGWLADRVPMVCLTVMNASLGDISAFTLDTFDLIWSIPFFDQTDYVFSIRIVSGLLADRVPMVCLEGMNASLGNISAFTLDKFDLIWSPNSYCQLKCFWPMNFRIMAFSACFWRRKWQLFDIVFLI